MEVIKDTIIVPGRGITVDPVGNVDELNSRCGRVVHRQRQA